MALSVSVDIQTWPLAAAFVISRGAKTEAHVCVATVSDGTHQGRGESVPYARYGETVEGVAGAIASLDGRLTTRAELAATAITGAARNAVDCALWDLEAKRAGVRAYTLAGLPQPSPRTTCYTVSLGAPDEMARAAVAAVARGLSLIKLKLGGDGDEARLAAVRAACPTARLVADANEAWTPALLPALMAAAAAARLEVVEQPLPASDDGALVGLPRPVPICADESLHTRRDLAALRTRYDAINVKLDKAGGLTEALALTQAARDMGFRIMVGCMVATSLAMAPAMLIAQQADWVDLDGPLLLARDRSPGLRYDGDTVHPPDAALWG
jgi:L-alanine-DL-glutamate epimerase-like enolase superfamily enzyme